eukprot:jgi/Chrzof1/2762/Cz11g28100.t1
MAEDKVVALLKQHNKPFSVQGVSDFLATQGVKKTQAQKALDALVESGKVTVKEFGKTKIYLPPQAGLQVLSKEELDAKKSQASKLQQELQQEAQGVKELEQELKGWTTSLTEEEVLAKTKELAIKVGELTTKLKALKGGTILVTAEERAAVEKAFCESMDHWRKRRGIFRSIWDAIAEGLDSKQADLFEDIGVETDEAAGITYKAVEVLMPKKRRL